MKIISFNVNGLRARPHQLEEIISKHQPDVIGLQETKVHDEAFPLQDLSHYGYHIEYFGQKSHYGVALFTKEKPIHIYKGFPNDAADAQRRLISAEIPTSQGIITIINGYFPQGESREHETKFPAKQRFYSDLNNYIQQYIKTPVIVMGDMNICPTDKDIGLKSDNKKRWLATGKCSFLPEERVWMNSLLENNLIDCYRHINPEKENEFSWFDYRSFGFDSNTGLRIDLILASQSLISYCTGSGIDYSIRAMEKPSDHAPVWVEFELYSK